MGLSGVHVFLIVIVVLIFFGPSRLPGLGKSMGEAIKGFKKGLDQDEIDVTQESARRESLRASAADPLHQQQTQAQKDKTRNDV